MRYHKNNDNSIYITGVPGEERENGVENLFKEIMAKNVPNLGKDFWTFNITKQIGHLKYSIKNILLQGTLKKNKTCLIAKSERFVSLNNSL